VSASLQVLATVDKIEGRKKYLATHKRMLIERFAIDRHKTRLTDSRNRLKRPRIGGSIRAT